MDINKLDILAFLILLIPSVQKSLFLNITFSTKVNISLINSSTFFNELLLNKLVINTNLGTPKQILPLKIKLKYSTLTITSTLSKYNNLTKKFNPKNSTSYSNISKIERFGYDEFINGIKSIEKFEFEKNKFIDDFKFILVTETYHAVSGIFGLKLDYDRNLENFSLLKQFKERNLISNLIFFFDFEKTNNSPLKYNGNLIIGIYPHEYYPIIYKKENYFEMSVSPNFSPLNEFFEIKYLEIYYGDKNYDFSEQIITEIDFSKNFILGTTKFKKYILEEFSKLYEGKCNTITSKGIDYILCDKDININKLKNLYLYNANNNYTFVLAPSDLFTSYDNKLYYLIYFKNLETVSTWSLGLVFIRKYNLVFDQEKKIIGCYNNKEVNFDINLLLKIFLILTCVIIIILITILMYYRKFLNKRKIRANELENDVDYISFNKTT